MHLGVRIWRNFLPKKLDIKSQIRHIRVMDYEKYIKTALHSLHEEGRYRVFTDLGVKLACFRARLITLNPRREKSLSGVRMIISAWGRTSRL